MTLSRVVVIQALPFNSQGGTRPEEGSTDRQKRKKEKIRLFLMPTFLFEPAYREVKLGIVRNASEVGNK